MSGRERDPMVIPRLDGAKAKRYSRARLTVLAATSVWGVARLAWFASDHRASRLQKAIAAAVPDRRLTAPCFIAVWTGLSWLTSLPVTFGGGYLVERRFALTKQRVPGWLEDQAKGLVLTMVIQVPLMTVAHQVMKRRPRDWWLMLSAAAVPFTVVFSHLAPVLLMPLFNAFTPLRDEDLRVRIDALTAKTGLRISDVYEMDMSRQSEKPNAMFTGIANSKRIILADTLLNTFTPDEIEAVVAHEMGHQVHGDIWRFIGVGAGAGFGVAWLLSRLAPPILRRTASRTGVTDVAELASLPILALMTMLLGFMVMPLQAAFSRAIERRADRFAVDLTGDGGAYARAMERLAVLALADPNPPRAAVLLAYSHPPVGERIQAARAAESARPGRAREEASRG